ncbi:MAG TPA: hypothetical protein VGC86_09585 [Afipia sp.]
MALNALFSIARRANAPESDAEFLVACWRMVASGDANSPRLIRAFAGRYGEDAEAIFERFFIFLRALAQGTRRQLIIGRPGHGHLTMDEYQVTSMLRAAQMENIDALDAHLSWLTKEEGRKAVSAAAQDLALALTASDTQGLQTSNDIKSVH